MEFHLISCIEFDSWRSDISCRRWSLAFPETKTQQGQKQFGSRTVEHIVEREGDWDKQEI